MIQCQTIHKQHGPYKQDSSSNLIPKKGGEYINQTYYIHVKNQQKIKYACAHHEKSDCFTIRSTI